MQVFDNQEVEFAFNCFHSLLISFLCTLFPAETLYFVGYLLFASHCSDCPPLSPCFPIRRLMTLSSLKWLLISIRGVEGP